MQIRCGITMEGYRVNRDEFESYIERATNSEVLAVDTEGYFEFNNKLLDVSQCTGLSFAGAGFETYLPFNHWGKDNIPGEWQSTVIKMVSGHKRLIMHNAKHDLNALGKLGINVQSFYCTMVMTHMVDENIPNKGLDYVSRMAGGMPKARPDIMQKMIDVMGWAYVPADMMYSYAANDARITYDYFQWLYPQFREQGFDGELWGYREKFIRLLGKMEQRGIRINTTLSTEELEFGEKRLAEITNELGINPGSPKDLGQLLLGELELPVVKRSARTGNPSFDKEAMAAYDEMLERLDSPIAGLVKEYRGWSKTVTSNYRPYLERLSSDGRLRCNYNMHRAVTGRLTCDKPNLQQIPKDSPKRWNGNLKKAFIGDGGYALFKGDYSQLEFRLAAAYAKDQALIAIFNNPKRDIFDEMSDSLGMSRFNTKTLNYTLQYGGGVQRLQHVFGVSYQKAKEIRDNYYDTYPLLRKVTLRAADRCKAQGYVSMWSGRRRHFAEPERHAHKAFNSVCQGGAADIVERAMIRLDEAGLNNDDCRMLLQIHDEVVFEIRNEVKDQYLPEIQRVMEAIPEPFGIKFAVKTGRFGE